MKKIYSEPLIHFLLIALFFFLAYQGLNPLQANEQNIAVSQGRIAQLKNSFIKTNNRPPREKELDNAIKAYALNEIYLREARSLGLNKNDRVIDRRLRQKMEYLLDDMAATRSPSNEDLTRFYQQNSHRYLAPARYSFSQVLISGDRPERELQAVLAKQQQAITAGKAPQGDIHLIPAQYTNKSPQQIERQFGDGFSKQLAGLKQGEWSGPLKSGLGLHFVLIEAYAEEKLKPYSQVEDEVLSDWRYENARIFKENFERELLAQYTIERQTVLGAEHE